MGLYSAVQCLALRGLDCVGLSWVRCLGSWLVCSTWDEGRDGGRRSRRRSREARGEEREFDDVWWGDGEDRAEKRKRFSIEGSEVGRS